MWAVRLGGDYKSYEIATSDELEACYQRGDTESTITCRGVRYVVGLKPPMMQKLESDPTRQRPVRRDTAAAPVAPAPAPVPQLAPPLALPPPVTGGKRAAVDDNKTAKAACLRAAVASSSASSSSRGAVLVFAPGAGGKTANGMIKLQRQLEQEDGLAVFRCDEEPMSWVTVSAGSAKNIAQVVSTANRAAAAHPGVPILLCGASFGNRVLAEALRTARAELPKAVALALVCCGYPLNAPGKPEGADPKRPAHLLQLPAEIRVLMMQGTDDEFNGARGITAVKELIGLMAAHVELFEIPGGEHTVPKAKGLKARGLTQEQVNKMLRGKLSAFAASLE